jgi:hypothetical protein
VEKAEADLALRRDSSQDASRRAPRAGQGSPAPAAAAGPSADPPSSSSMPRAAEPVLVEDYDLRRRRKADADRAEEEAIAARRKNAVDEGRWLEKAAAAGTWMRELTKLLTGIETFLANTLARALVDGGYARPGLDWKALSVAIIDQWRRYRAGVSVEAGQRRAALAPKGHEK